MDEEVEFKKGSTKVATSVNQNQAVGTSLVQQGVQAATVAKSVNKTQAVGTNMTQQGVSGNNTPAKANNFTKLK